MNELKLSIQRCSGIRDDHDQGAEYIKYEKKQMFKVIQQANLLYYDVIYGASVYIHDASEQKKGSEGGSEGGSESVDK